MPVDVAGEYIRRDVTEEEKGIPLTLDLGVYDIETCEPVTDTWVEIWCKYSSPRPGCKDTWT